ncbi:subtilisin-like protein [Lactarius quietus]|nr:subtilisin-like protein [Lactarius quietus]
MRRHHLSMLLALTVVPLGCLTTLLAPRWDKLKVKHSWKAVPDNWESLGLPPAGTTLNLHVALRSHHENALIEALHEVSSPRHPRYGSHLSKEQVAALVMPHPDTLELVHSWLEYHGVLSSSVSVTHGSNWLTLTGVSVSKANDLLGASYQLYRHADTNEMIVRTVGYSLPEVLHAHVQTVAPTTFFSSGRMLSQTERMRSNGTARLVKAVSGKPVTVLSTRDEEEVTASFLHELYQSFAYVPVATDRNKFGISGYSKEYPNPEDLAMFMHYFHGPDTGATYTVEVVANGGYDPDDPGLEANVDVQYASVMIYPTPIIYYSTGRGPLSETDPYFAWLDFILEKTHIPQTISTSYAEYERNFPLDYARTVCDRFAELGARGVSVLFATGDTGVGQGNCEIKGRRRFLPTFPATCPWVTSVGGTTDFPEVAAELSVGGFSDYFLRPDYQDEVVPTYFESLGNQYAGLYNVTGRGIPDISAQALNIPIFLSGQYLLAIGTSCSTPIVAGIISLLNDYRLSLDKHPLGFLNPLLYGEGRVRLNDIIYGSNPGCGTEGFPATVGWDPVTGLGTPNFLELQSLAKTYIPSSVPTPTQSGLSIGSTTRSGVPPSTTGTPSAPLSKTGTPTGAHSAPLSTTGTPSTPLVPTSNSQSHNLKLNTPFASTQT